MRRATSVLAALATSSLALRPDATPNKPHDLPSAAACSVVACGDASAWTAVDTLDSLNGCGAFQLHPDSSHVQACRLAQDSAAAHELRRRDTELCLSNATSAAVQLAVGMAGDGSNMTWTTADALTTTGRYLSSSANCDLKQTYYYGQGAIVGVFSGAAIDNMGSAGGLLAEAATLANNSVTGASEAFYMQRCADTPSVPSSPSVPSLNTFGVAFHNGGNMTWVRHAVSVWAAGGCLNASSFDLLALADPTHSVVSGVVWEYSHPAVVLRNVSDNATTSASTPAASSGMSSVLPSSPASSAPTTAASSAAASSAPVSSGPATGSYSTPPAPTQTGIVANCNGYSVPGKGQGCSDFADAHGITLDDFYAWNPAVGKCANFWAGEAYCISVSASSRSLFEYLVPRGDCKTATVASGDSCASLATKCGISGADFTKYNSAAGLCANLAVGQRVCCSAGTLPDITPKPNANGSCAAYVVKSGDTCSAIAAANGINTTTLELHNNGTTWGWSGCSGLQAGMNICLSKGTPPLPSPVDGAQCGPQVPGTVMPTNGTALADLNQCPLNACCDKWGQCGITPAYCTNHTGPSGNPGTSPKGENGCISNCGTDIVNNGAGPDKVIRVGYYETWNYDRPCLNMRVVEIDTSTYTHIHWAFATISDDLTVVINDTYKQWSDFKALPIKRIVSIGGWGYSTDAATYDRLRKAMDPDNAVKFAKNIVKFLNDEGIDGIDFDWEYPGAPDIPGIPAGLASDGPNYQTFLSTLRGNLGLDTTKTISFAAPASYWYLQHFPVAKMSHFVDYIVYMTYDLHGQWDYNNTWSQDGCAHGNCLRSHVNITETMYALAMITKAGVNTNVITVGVSSYGRAFGMADAACSGPQCTYTGSYDVSSAQPGACTMTGGYMGNAEIFDYIYGNQSTTKSWYDEKTDSSYAVFANDIDAGSTWVAYMTDDVKAARVSRFAGLNFAGTVDWAVDLAAYGSFEGDAGDGDGDDDDDDTCVDTATYSTYEICSDEAGDIDVVTCDSGPGSRSVDDLTDDEISGWPAECSGQYMLTALGNTLTVAHQNFTDLLADNYDHHFSVYAKAVAKSAGEQVHQFMTDHGNDYFSCTITEFVMCCSQCKANAYTDSYCDYCFDDDKKNPCYVSRSSLRRRGDYNPQNNRVLNVHYTNTTQPCPPDYSKRGYGPDDPYEQTIYWSLRDDKADAFYADLLDATGIPKDKIGFGLYTDSDTCSGSGHKAGDGDECWNNGYEFGAAFPNGYGVADVSNPKQIAQNGLDNAADLPGQIAALVNDMSADSFLGSEYDVIDAVSLPIFMIAQGVESMSTVIQTAEKIEEAERKAIILAFLSAILFFIPIAGEVAGAVADIASIVAILDIIGTAGTAALDVYTIVDDPKNAPLAIVSLIMAPLALADIAVVARAANLQRGMKAADLAKLGDRVGARIDKVKRVTSSCKA